MRFVALDSWRGIAALLVAIFHFNGLGHFYQVPFVRNSDLFVDFFFVLSGFVIAHAYSAQLSHTRSLGPFMLRRFGRVWPLHVSMLALFIAFPLAEWLGCRATGLCGTEWPFNEEAHGATTILSNILLLHSLGVHDQLVWNWPSWSISTEFYTYLLFGVVCVFARGALIPAAFALALGSAVVVLAFAPKGMAATYDFGYFRCVMGFFCGVLVFRLFQTGKTRPVVLAAPNASEALAAIAVVGFVSAAGRSWVAVLAPIIFSLCVLVFAHEAGSASRFLKTAPLRKIGEWSYSIYMVHALILIVLLRVVRGAERVLGTDLRVTLTEPPKLYFYKSMYFMDGAVVGYLVVVLLVGALTYRFIEQPARAYFNRRAAKLEEVSSST